MCEVLEVTLTEKKLMNRSSLYKLLTRETEIYALLCLKF